MECNTILYELFVSYTRYMVLLSWHEPDQQSPSDNIPYFLSARSVNKKENLKMYVLFNTAVLLYVKHPLAVNAA